MTARPGQEATSAMSRVFQALERTEGSLGLAVTEGNPAIGVYESLGFRRILTSYSVDL